MGIKCFCGIISGKFSPLFFSVYLFCCPIVFAGLVFRLPPGILFPFSQKTDIFLLLNWLCNYFKERCSVAGYPGSQGKSFTKPAKRNLPFLQAGQLGWRWFLIRPRISFHTVSCFSQTWRPSSRASSCLFWVS